MGSSLEHNCSGRGPSDIWEADGPSGWLLMSDEGRFECEIFATQYVFDLDAERRYLEFGRSGFLAGPFETDTPMVTGGVGGVIQ
jgi:hypothetical protein